MIGFSADSIARSLTTRRLGRPVLYFERVGSTNDVARARASAGAAEGLLVVAGEQTAGRGREDRKWWAPPDTCLLFSLLLRPPIPPALVAQTTMCLGLGAVEGITETTGLTPALKWPNDLLLGEGKVAGMLTEMETNGDRLDWVILGLGINVNFRLAVSGREPSAAGPGLPMVEAPDEVAGIAASLGMALGRAVDRLALLAAILAATERWYEKLLAGESPHEAWAARLSTVGRAVHVALPGDRAIQGVVQGVNARGALLVRAAGGQVHAVWAGDVRTLT